MAFFMKKLPLNKDLERHRERENQLRESIRRLEEAGEQETAFYLAYQNLLIKLLESKGKLAGRVGRDKQ